MLPKFSRYVAMARLIIVGGLLSLVALQSSLAAKKQLAHVFVSAQASEEYQARRSSPEGLVPESYHIMKGKFYGGKVRDRSLEDASFQSLADSLKMELVKREYYPARKFKEGDLLIVVHWGVTDAPEDESEDFGTEDGETPPEVYNESDELSQRVVDEKVLGFDKASDDNSLSIVQRQILLSQSFTERYFFILQAYDWQKKLETGETELLWTTRFSLDSGGTNFVDSYPALFRASSDLFGANLEGMAHAKTNFGEGEITMGELEVIESAKEAKDIK